MVSRKVDDHPRPIPEVGSTASRWDKLMEKHGGTLVPMGLVLALVALMAYGMCAPR
ncbi:MAG: hypothetical protein U0359_15925 [Byssovorax sp.]